MSRAVSQAGSRMVRIATSSAVAAFAAAALPPLAMTGLWALLSGNPADYFQELGVDSVGGFVLSQQRFFLPVVVAGLGAHIVLICLHRFHPLVYVLAFYTIGTVVYMTTTVPQLAAFSLDPPVARTLAADAFLWWGPAAALSGLVFWSIASRPLRRAARLSLH